MTRMAVQLPVSIQTKMITEKGRKIYYPIVVGLKNNHIEEKINQKIFNLVKWLIEEQYKEQGASSFIEMIGTFEIKTNERNVLSLSFSNYAYAEHHAHGLTLMKSLTFDIQTGKSYQLKDLFKPGSNYISILSKMIQQQIRERNIQLLNEFTEISADQDFYIADKTLVIYFQLYEITPYYVGFPMFPISAYSLENILIEDGPLGRMLVN